MTAKAALPLLLLLLWSFAAAPQSQESVLPADMKARIDLAVAKVKPALVRISVVSLGYSEGRELKYEASGSGVIITPEGHVVTNHHVAGYATRIKCTLSTREEIDAELVGQDPLSDLAIIKLTPAEPRTFLTADFGDSDAMQVGDSVLAMGSPLALSQSVTLGILSNTELVLPERRFGRMELEGENVGSLVRWFGHDADIFPGNSGGPLVNLDGEIIGINEISIGLGGAIPGNLAKAVSEELMTTGKVRRAWFGVGVQPRLDSMTLDKGILVNSVITGSPAEAAGLEPGDVIAAVNEVPVDVRFEEQLPGFNQLLASLPVGEPAAFQVLRGDTTETLNLSPIEREEAAPQQHEVREWGATMRNISLMMSKEMKRKNTEGVVVTTTRPGGPLGEAKPNIDRNDVIVKVNDTDIKSLDDLRAVTAEVLKDAGDALVPVLVTYERKQERFVTVARIGIAGPNDPARQVQKPWLPVDTQVLTRDIATQMGDADLTGFRVTYVYGGSTAETAGVQLGDIIVAVDGMALEATEPEDYEELSTLIRQYKLDSEVELDLLRGGERQKLAVKLAPSPKEPREMARYESKEFEFAGRDVTEFDRAKEKIPGDRVGVLVDDVKSGGWAALGGLSPGDIVLKVDGAATPDVTALEAAMNGIAEAKPKTIVLLVLRGIQTQYLEIQPRWEDA